MKNLNNDQGTAEMRDAYDKAADDFKNQSGRFSTWLFVGEPAMQRMLKPYLRPGVKILDLGSASGRVELDVLLPNGIRPEDITGVELSPKQVEMAREAIPAATFVVGDISNPSLLPDALGSFDVVITNMVFEHLDDAQLQQTCINAYRLAKPNGIFAFVVTHPVKMVDQNGDYVRHYGEFITKGPWGTLIHNWRRTTEDTVKSVTDAGFVVKLQEDLAYPEKLPEGMSAEDAMLFERDYEKYRKDSAIRFAVLAIKA